jgi:hypothetical protein
MRWLSQIAVAAVVVFVIVVFGLFAFNFYRRAVAVDEPGAKPPVIFQRTDTPSRA